MSRLLVLRESAPSERRVAVVPGDLGRLASAGLEVHLEQAAGQAAGYPDEDYETGGAVLAPSGVAGSAQPGDLVVKVRPPSEEEAAILPERATLLCFFPPGSNLEVLSTLRDRKVTVLSFDLVPRISRAQVVDALSSQASAAGYQAAVLATHRLGRIVPMMMTAAGTIPPARFFVMGAGVAGLQAIATARRLGASVNAYDVRPEAAEEVRSLGAKFVELPLQPRQGSGGYAAEQTEDFLRRQQELLADTVAGSDAVITTAAVPGRRAPLLVGEEMVSRMRRGSVIVDMASASGGNCELTRDGEEIEHEGVLVIGAGNLASDVATSASALYSRNVANLVGLLIREGRVPDEPEDEIVTSMRLTADGKICHEPTRVAMEEGAGR